MVAKRLWFDGLLQSALQAEAQPAPGDAAAAAVTAGQSHDSLAAARQLTTCWEGLKCRWPPTAAQPQELIAAAAAAAYGTQAAAASPDGPGPGGRSARSHLLGCADVALQWAAAGLPEDAHLIDSAAAMWGAQLLPVMADPEGFGAAWVRWLHRDTADFQVQRSCSFVDVLWRS
jgi:hypothetical protein